MSNHCLNCGHPVKEKFCPQCGQGTDTGRITWKSFASEFIHTLTHAERSILGTTWQLLVRPGRVLDEYIAGKRKKYQSPVGFFLIGAALSILLHVFVISRQGFHPVYMPGLTFDDPESIKAYIRHGQWFNILSIPLSAGLFYFILGRPRYSFIESIVILLYSSAELYVFFILCYLVGGLLLSLNVLHWKFYLFQIVLTQLYGIWACGSLLGGKNIRLLWLRMALYMVVNVVAVLKLLEFLSGLYVRAEGYIHL